MEVKLSWLQMLRMNLFGSVPIGKRARPGWKGPIMFYAFRCEKHGIVENYPHGKGGLRCPLCIEDSWKYA